MPWGFSSTAQGAPAQLRHSFFHTARGEVVGLLRIEVGMREQLPEMPRRCRPAGTTMCAGPRCTVRPVRARSAGRSIITGTMRARGKCRSKRCTCSTPFWMTARRVRGPRGLGKPGRRGLAVVGLGGDQYPVHRLRLAGIRDHRAAWRE